MNVGPGPTNRPTREPAGIAGSKASLMVSPVPGVATIAKAPSCQLIATVLPSVTGVGTAAPMLSPRFSAISDIAGGAGHFRTALGCVLLFVACDTVGTTVSSCGGGAGLMTSGGGKTLKY